MMKFLDIRRLRYAGMMLSALVAAMLCWSCERFMDGEGYCPTVYKVKFRYTKNILDADAFPSKVESVSLFVFNKQGVCIDVITESGAALADENYAMVLDLPAGTYDLIAWCGLADNNDFALAEADNPQTRDDLICSLLPSSRAEAECRKPLHPLWHGMADDVVLPADQTGEQVVETIYLTKDTNTIRVILQHYKGLELVPDDFEFSITDDNGIMNWDNSLLPCDMITYREYAKKSAEVSLPDADADSGERTAVSSLIAEIDVARLVTEGGHKSPVLTVSHPDVAQPVLRLPLTDLILVAKGEYRKDMDDQEYLDRQDEYNFIFFLDDAGWYINGGIWINSWHIRDFTLNM